MDEKDVMIQELRMENKVLAKMCRSWISVKDRLPDPFKPVLVARVYAIDEPLRVEQGMYDNRNGSWKVYGAWTKKVLFWMPLPEPPEVAK